MNSGWTAGVLRVIERLAFLGVSPDDPEDVREQKATLTLAASTVTLLAVIWVGTYLALGLPVSAAIPLGYQIVSIVSLVLFAWTKGYRLFRFSQILLMTLLPFALQWSLGGYVASSAVSLWALVAVFGALFFYSAADSVRWFVVFVGLTILSGWIDPMLSAHPAPIPDEVGTAFFVLNITGVSLTAFLLLQYSIRAREAARARSERLLLNVLPRAIADRLKRDEGVIADAYDDVTVLFADIAGFTPFADRTPPEQVVGILDDIFSAFDALATRHGLEKIKTIGDAYMVVGGLPEPRPDHAAAAADLGLEMLAEFDRICTTRGLDLDLRIGIDSGPVIAGVIGRSKFIYDLWGDTVNTASRMESQGLPGRVQVTDATYRRLRDRYRFEERGEIEIKGKGRLPVYLLVGRSAST
jgi:adenylate cyclase